jgi:hypothetical protein
MMCASSVQFQVMDFLQRSLRRDFIHPPPALSNSVSVLHDFGSCKGAKTAKEGSFSQHPWRLGVKIVNY